MLMVMEFMMAMLMIGITMMKGKIQHNCKLLPEDIRTKINTRNNIRKHNPLDPNLAQLNNEITSDIQHHKTALWKSHLDGNWDHRENTHTLW